MARNDEMLMAIDGGGTSCRAALCDRQGNLLGLGKSGAANIMTNLDGAFHNIAEASKQALAAADCDNRDFHEISAVLGLAGSNIGDYASRLSDRLPFKEAVIETDARIALEGAIGSDDGVVAIIGTGSVFIYRKSGQIKTAGGWGFMVGDLASGAWLGRALLQEVLLSYDGIHPGSPLTEQVLAEFEHNPQTVVEYAHTAKPGEFGTLAPKIFEFADRGDPIATQIIRQAVADIEETLDAIVDNGEGRFCLLGGLGTVYSSLLGKFYRDRVQAPLGDAVAGAIRLAVQRFGDGGVGYVR